MKKILVLVLSFMLIGLVLFGAEFSKYKVDSAKCIGCTLCVQKCPVKAIEMVEGKAVIDTAKCIGCGICANVCPVKAIDKIENLEEKSEKIENKKEETTKKVEDKKEVKIKKYEVDPAKCVGCQICVPKCPVKAIEMIEGKAVIDTAKCIGCGICANVCPVKAISQEKEEE